MDIESVDVARAELRRLGAELTAFELAHPTGAAVPPELLRGMAAAARTLITTIGCYIVENAPPTSQTRDIGRRKTS